MDLLRDYPAGYNVIPTANPHDVVNVSLQLALYHLVDMVKYTITSWQWIYKLFARMSEHRPWRPTVRSSPSGMTCSWCGTPPSMTTSPTRGCPGRRSGPRTLSSTTPPGTGSRAGRWGLSSRSVSVCSIVSFCPVLLFPDWFNLLLTQIIKTISILVRAGQGQGSLRHKCWLEQELQDNVTV